MFTALAAFFAFSFPVALAMGAVFLFAGPHNWMEARYFVARMPARWGRQRLFFQAAIAGVVALCPTFSLIHVHRSLWHTAAACWVLLLVRMGRKEAYGGALPLAFFWMAGAWAAPGLADLLLVFLHPLAALWFVRRQIARTRPQWLPGFRAVAIAVVPLSIVVLLRASAADLAVAPSNLSFAPVPPAPALIALHAFLELLHYGAWVILLPAIGLNSAPWDFRRVPLARSNKGWRQSITAVFAAGAVVVLLLWVCLLIDFRKAYDAYFTLAIVHVMAEVPFLVKLR
jgi:hypothetical protein